MNRRARGRASPIGGAIPRASAGRARRLREEAKLPSILVYSWHCKFLYAAAAEAKQRTPVPVLEHLFGFPLAGIFLLWVSPWGFERFSSGISLLFLLQTMNASTHVTVRL